MIIMISVSIVYDQLHFNSPVTALGTLCYFRSIVHSIIICLELISHAHCCASPVCVTVAPLGLCGQLTGPLRVLEAAGGVGLLHH